MTTILCRRTVSGLSADDDAATCVLRRIKPGDVVRVEVRRPRNLSAHRRWFALVNMIYANSEDYGSPELVHAHLKLLAGHADPIVNKATGETYLVPKSISFSSMDEDQFQALWARVVPKVCTEIIPGISEPEIEDEINRLVGASTWQR